MSDTVFVDNLSAIHAGSPGKSTAFPDVNLCPPAPPAGPVPVPLPNVAQAADLAGGASTVNIAGNPMAKKSSYLARSTGNAVARSTGGGVMTHVVEGQARFVSYSMTVMVEGEPVPRHLDIMTHNHAATPGEAIGCYMGTMAVPSDVAPAVAPEPIERKDKQQPITYEFCVQPAAWKSGQQRYRLRSEDGKYDQLGAEAGRKGEALVRIAFRHVLPARSYDLTLETGDQVFTVFTSVPFVFLRDHQEIAPRPAGGVQAVPADAALPPLPEPIVAAEDPEVDTDWHDQDQISQEKKP